MGIIVAQYFSLDVRVQTDVQDWLEKNVGPKKFYIHGGWIGGEGWAIDSPWHPYQRTKHNQKFNLEVSNEKIATYLILRFG